MSLLDTILSANNGAAIGQIAKQLGLPDEVAKQAAGALTPALARGLQRNASKPGGLDSLLGALSGGNHQQYVDQPEKLTSADTIADGDAILGHILGSKDVSRNVAGAAAQQTGVETTVLKKMLPMLGAVAMGALAKETAGGKLTGVVPGLSSSSNPLGMLSGLLDSDKDGSSTDDLLDLAKKFF
jgi:hypothetical protein